MHPTHPRFRLRVGTLAVLGALGGFAQDGLTEENDAETNRGQRYLVRTRNPHGTGVNQRDQP